MKRKLRTILSKSWKVFKEVSFYFFFITILVATSTNFLGRLRGERPEIFGFSTLIVVSSSMEPTYKVKEFLLMKEVPFESVKWQDVISFNYDIDEDVKDDLVTHRVVGIKENGDLLVKGDSPMSEHQIQTVTPSMFEGKIVFNSYFIGWILYSMVEYNIFIFMMAAFFIYLIVRQAIKVAKIYSEEVTSKKAK